MATNDEVKRTVGTQSVSGPSGPSKPAPSVEYSESKLGEIKTVHDGTSSTQYSAESDPVLKALHTNPPLAGFGGKESEHYALCINPSCKSFGKSHPNCLCYAGPGGSSLEGGMFAHGGQVCQGPHNEKCEHYASGGEVEENKQLLAHPVDTLDHVAVHQGLLGLLTKVGKSKSEDLGKHLHDYISSSRKGHKELHNHIENLFTNHGAETDKDSREALKKHLQDLREHPEKALEVGGSLGSMLPDHAAQLGKKTGDAIAHFNAIRPVQSKALPLDEITPIDKREQATYDRHIDIANNPATILNHVKDGTLLPSDLSALSALYPTLHKSIVDKAGEALISAKAKNMEIPYKQKQSLSLLTGSPLDSTMTPMAMQAIIHSAGPQQMQQQAKSKPKKASGVELREIDKVNDLSTTSLQARQFDKRD